MVDTKKSRCPTERSFILDTMFRRWFQNPRKILSTYIKEGMIVLDIGCGPGFFSIDIAQMVGRSGRVIACDVQEEMLRKIREKISGTVLEQRITLHQCQGDKIGVSGHIDFVLAFYMMHEVENQEQFFCEIGEMLSPNGQILIVEPPFHVSIDEFEETIRIARKVGFAPAEMPKIPFSKSVILRMN